MFKIAVCEKEEYYKVKIQNLLQEYFLEKEISYTVDVYHSGVQILQLGVGVKEYDAIFLEVSMQDLNGIETAKQIRMYTRQTCLVFVTADAANALEGYKVNAIRCILKAEKTFDMNFVECMDAILTRVDNNVNMQLFEFQGGRKKVALSNIMYVESNLHKLYFYIRNDDIHCYTMYGKLDLLEGKFQACGFCRIHKSYLVNLIYVEELKRYRVILTDGNELNVAKQRYKEVVSKYTSYCELI
ncbi:DNA-binding response regulator [Anaerocolumna cellulosilytica]|uniref:Stage 0 sporulation protein A homolog n=1 Tax=Anaerocolumna cellulosilytica TaxID=433286 RepID=A0A6S6R575_9FIRM|nr:LytTR family transcriptional regulator DNA-binding domain-containing protein [Anaerocolumna cellulosilytica]MBB5194828.1 DNA-binding LytR/AlgR family response regulator [Anaerocolumna cellulosilytica]BCJ94208.1 DNA-binding response regulator [Anaerocolumna cellulosilytica]